MKNGIELGKPKENLEEIEPRDSIKEIAKEICKKYILDILQQSPKCFTSNCSKKNFEEDECKTCPELTFKRDKNLIKSWWSELLFDYANMNKAYELVRRVLNEFSSLKDFREKAKKPKAFWEFVDYSAGQSNTIKSCKDKEKKGKTIYILYDKNNKEIAKVNSIQEIRKKLTKLLPKGTSLKKSNELLEDFLLGKKDKNVRYSLEVKIVKK